MIILKSNKISFDLETTLYSYYKYMLPKKVETLKEMERILCQTIDVAVSTNSVEHDNFNLYFNEHMSIELFKKILFKGIILMDENRSALIMEYLEKYR